MSKIRSTDHPVERMAKLMAELYYFMAKEMIDRLGPEEGPAAVRQAIRSFGEARVASMKEEAAERKLPINLETYGIVRDMPGDSWQRDPANPCDITYCPMEDMWSELGDREIARIYCEIDDILFEGFNTRFERPLCKTDGDSVCRFLATPK